MVEIVPSKDTRAHAEELGWEFSDLEKAALVLSLDLPVERELAALEELKGGLSDARVVAQIDEYVASERERFRLVAEPAGCVYVVMMQEADDADEWPHGIFADLESARAFGARLAAEEGVEFTVEKHQLLGEGLPLPAGHVGMFNPNLLPDAAFDELVVEGGDPDDVFMDAERAWLHYSAEGELLRFWTADYQRPRTREDVERAFDLANFENAYVSMPNPFEAGDVVRGVGPAARLGVGVVETSQEQWAKWKERRAAGEAEWADFSDEQLTVSFWVPEGDFSHHHVQPVYLERCEIPKDAPEWRPIMSASDLLAGRGGLDWFLMYLDGYREQARTAAEPDEAAE